MKPRAGDADLWIRIWEELHKMVKRGIFVEVEHVEAHRTIKEKENMSKFETFVTEGNEKADDMAKTRAMTKDSWQKQEQRQWNRKERRCTQHCSMRPVSNVWWSDGKIVKSSGPSRKKSGFRGKGEGEYEASNRVVCGSRQVSVYEMWKRKQIYEDARKVYRAKVLVKKVWESGEDDIWEAMTWSEGWTDREKSCLVQKVFGIREAKNGAEAGELL